MKLNQKQLSAIAVVHRLLLGSIFILLVSACEKEKKDPALEATSIVALSASEYNVTFKITEPGDYKIADYGVIYSVGTSSQYWYSYDNNNKVSLGSIINGDTYTASIKLGAMGNYYGTNLKVFAKAYITNNRGTVYSREISTDLLKLGVTRIVPATTKPGDTITLEGIGYSTSLNANSVSFNNVSATVVAAASTYLKVIVPDGIQLSYWNNGITLLVNSGGQTFQMDNAINLLPTATGFTPSTGNWSSYITVQGSNLYNALLYFDDVPVANGNQSYNSISASIPYTLTKKKFKIYISINGIKTEVPGGYFTMSDFEVNPLSILNYNQGTSITFVSSGFNPNVTYNKLLIGSKSVSSKNTYTGSDLSFTIPSTLADGSYPVKLTNGADTTATAQIINIKKPTITGVTPSPAYPGTELTITGTNFFTNNQNVIISFGSYSFYANMFSTNEKITMRIPYISAGVYPIDVYWDGLTTRCTDAYTVLEPKLTSIVPSSGSGGTSAVINGEGFGVNNSIAVRFGNLDATVMSATDNQINIKVPSGISKGTWIVYVILNYSNPISTTVTFTVP
jgi:hypothetical protein